MPCKDNDKEHGMHSKSDNTAVTINNKADEVIKEIFQSILSRYQIELEKSTKGSDFIFYCVHLLYHKCHKINFKRDQSYKDSYDWIRNKKLGKNKLPI